MIPQIAEKLILDYRPNARRLFDPYCGSGTALVEGILHGAETFGTDLNPLARLLAEAKTNYIDLPQLDSTIKSFLEYSMSTHRSDYDLPVWLEAERISFWFKPQVVQKLLAIYSFISRIIDRPIALFFLAAFSEVIRECSNTRNGEFKLFRKRPDILNHFNPDVFRIMIDKLGRNRSGYGEMHGFIGSKSNWRKTHIFEFNTVDSIPENTIPDESIDIVITSPPYGDSRTTVAYGQYSRLSSEWLGFEEAKHVDKNLMGGRRARKKETFGLESLDDALDKVHQIDSKRVLDVVSFYQELEASINNVSKVVCLGGYASYVVANRKVKGTVLPTDDSIVHFFESNGFKHIATHYRSIPNKRMPARNSPSNVTGSTDNTMHSESIVVMQKVSCG